MATGAKVTINADEYLRSLKVLSGGLSNGIRRGLNDAAYMLRTEWINAINETLNNPKPFTKKAPFVKEATLENLEAKTFLLPIQEQYLGHLVEGQGRVKGDIGTTRAGVLTPVGAKLDKYGNFPKNPKQWLADQLDIDTKKRRVFMGAPFKRARAIWEALPGDRLRLLATFKGSVPYAQRLPLAAISQTFADRFFDEIMQKNIDKATGK